MPDIDPDIFKSPHIEVPRELVAEYQFGLLGTGETIKVKIYKPVGRAEPFYGHASHDIKTPGQADWYRPNEKPAKSIDEAVRYAVNDIMTYFETAVNQGQEPKPDWLQRNRYF